MRSPHNNEPSYGTLCQVLREMSAASKAIGNSELENKFADGLTAGVPLLIYLNASLLGLCITKLSIYQSFTELLIMPI